MYDLKYDAKLCCANCGYTGFYQLPRGYEFMEYFGKNPEDCMSEVRLSGLREGVNNEDCAEKQLLCNNCRMPFLYVKPWDDDERRGAKARAKVYD